MSELTSSQILNALSRVPHAASGQDVVSAGLISGLVIRDGKIGFIINISPDEGKTQAGLREACEAAVKTLPGVVSVTAVLTAEREAPEAKKPAVWNKTPVDHVRHIIAVASGKGGVGKSTTTVNLALALTAAGKRVGILDADIYGPSIPRMMGLSGQPEIAEGKMQPLAAYGITCMSLGFLTDEAAILRGPMIGKTLTQMLRGTRWAMADAPLDVLLVDMPPGTGDVQLSLAQQTPLHGAIIVTTPQEVALMDARKALTMFRKVSVPVLGVIENMSWLEDTSGRRQYLFGQGGGKKLAQETNAPFLGEIPIDAVIGTAADNGMAYTGKCQNVYASIATKVLV